MRQTELQTYLRTVVQTLRLSIPLDVREVVARVGEHLRVPIHLRAEEFPTAQASGVAFRISNPDHYVIAYQAATVPGHQTHVIYHELIHILRGHLEASSGTIICRGQRDIRESISPEAEQLEWEAEVGATILSGWSRSNPWRQSQAGRDHLSERFASVMMGASWG